jgi:hypothetical protein
MLNNTNAWLRLGSRMAAILVCSAGVAGAQSITFDALPRANKDAAAKPVAAPRKTVAPARKDTVRVVDTVRVADTVLVKDSVRTQLPTPTQTTPSAPARPAAVTFAPSQVSGLLQVLVSGGDAAALKSSYRIRRAELKIVSDLGRKAQAIVMIDAAKALSLTSTAASSSVTQSSRALQDAILALPVRSVSIEAGQQRLPLGYEGAHSSSTLETIERALMESDRARGASFGDVRDLGVAAKGKWKKLEYKAGVFNGSGETMNETADRNVAKAVVGQLRVTVPFVKGLRVGASGATSGEPAGDKPVRDRVGADVIYVRGPLHLQAEAMTGQDAAIRREGMYVLAGWTVKSLKLVARFDAWDPNTRLESATADVTERDYLAGFTWAVPSTRLKLQTAVVRKTWTRDVTAPITQALTQLQASW